MRDSGDEKKQKTKISTCEQLMNNCEFARQGRLAKLLDAAAMDLMFKLAAVQVCALKINPHCKES